MKVRLKKIVIERKTHILLAAIVLLLLILFSRSEFKCDSSSEVSSITSSQSTKLSSRIFISLGLCHGHNPDVYEKANYPYAEASLQAVKLWKHFLPEVEVLVTLVHSHEEQRQVDMQTRN